MFRTVVVISDLPTFDLFCVYVTLCVLCKQSK